MKKISLLVGCAIAASAFMACGSAPQNCPTEQSYTIKTAELVVPENGTTPAYVIVEKTQVDLSVFPKDKDGWITLFCGNSLYGWRGYLKDEVPARWVIDDGAIKFNGTGMGEGQKGDGGDLIFAHKFQNFEVSIDWKVSPGANSGIMYLIQEIKDQPPYISAPESQVLDNERHPDAKLGVDGNRKSSSLYDMIPAKPQNAKPAGEWNTTTILVYKGTVVHNQNGVNVLEYHLWTPQWTEMLQASKFSQEKWPLAFELLNNCGGAEHKGYIGLQDHGDDVWYRNIRIKVLE
ncbi:glycosyl hydrolase [Bacteroidia bacterium]|nr:glycosyl hydrolase [Bacteroidia bacterium]